MRAIATDPEVLLFDEPTSALDPTMVDEVANIIKDLSQKQLTMLIVTHELSFARNVSNRIFYLDEGIIYEEGTPDEIFDNPQKPKTKSFILKSNSFETSFNKTTFDLYLLISDFMKYLSIKRINISNVNDMNLLLEEITINEILANCSGSDKITLQMSINNNCVNIAYSNLNSFNFDLNNTNKLSKSIIESKILNKTIDKDNKLITYRINLR